MPVDAVPAPAEPGRSGPRRFRALVAYDGTAYHGWARQAGMATVEGVLQAALARVLRVPDLALTCAGRTDAGVHATGQVVHFDAETDAADPRLLRGVNAVLPPDVRVRRIDPAPAGFDARFAALWRHYRYCVTDSVPDPLQRHTVLPVRGALDVAAMQQAVIPLLGVHDFGSFCKARQGATSVRQLQACSWRRDPSGVVVLDVRADAFCHSMVRSIVGASLEVGAGRRDPAWLAALIERPSRSAAAPVAPPQGLVLVAVGYPPDELLAARIAQTRRLRTGPDGRGARDLPDAAAPGP